MGIRIKDYIEEHGIKQTFLAEKTGITKNRIFSICAGSEPKAYEYFRICKALDLPLDYFNDEE